VSYSIIAGINLAANFLAHPLPNCRLYYSQVTVDPQKSIDYVQRNRNKKGINISFVTNSHNNITSESSVSAFVNSGVVHSTAVLICPFIGAVANSGFGQNVLQSTLHKTYENVLQQINLVEKLTSSDFGAATGLINQGYWEASKSYFVNVERKILPTHYTLET